MSVKGLEATFLPSLTKLLGQGGERHAAIAAMKHISILRIKPSICFCTALYINKDTKQQKIAFNGLRDMPRVNGLWEAFKSP